MPSEERRSAARHSRRIEVRFWRPEKAQAYSGFTTNISTSGLFLGTTQSLEPGERVRLEVVDSKVGFVVEGLVARVHRVAIALRHVDQPGAGVRFMDPEELVAKLVPALRGRGAAARPRAHRPVAERASGGEVGRPSTIESPGTSTSPPSAGNAEPARPENDALGVSAATVQKPKTRRDAPLAIPVDLTDRTSFLSIYHRDLSSGTLFVSTDVPASVQDTVIIELNTPVASSEPLRLEAQVVHRFEPEAAVGNGRNVLAGMGVRFTDLEKLKKALAPVLAELRR